MEQSQLIQYLMFTPLERLPPMPANIESEKNTILGLQILKLLQQDKIKVNKMDENGFLHIDTL